MNDRNTLTVKVWGPLACFTRPEMKVERVSYDVMTPSAARGILEAIFWKPEFSWRVRSIDVLEPIRRFSLLRNEVKSKASSRSVFDNRFYADEDRTQRNTLALREVAYISSEHTGTCMLCGEQRPIAKRMPVEQRLGRDQAPLITANMAAFQSYGQDASEVATLCFECGQKWGMAMSYLRNSDRHRYRTGSVVHLFWTKHSSAFSPVSFLEEAESKDIQELFLSVYRGRQPSGIEAEDFYALSIQGVRKRMVVRNWLETTVEEVRQNLADYFRFQRMVGPDGEDSFYPLRTLALSLGRDFDSIPVQAEDALLACAIQGSPMPTQVLHQVIRRARADSENRMTRPRAALIRLVFESQRSHGLIQEDREVTPELDTENRNPAYLCGRLLAVLERIQKVAIGAKATIVDRYFGTASSAPATVFGKLMRGAQNHLGKLRKNNKGAYYGLDRQLQEICTEIPEFPRTLSLQEQALFSLGYYHQKAADQRAASEGATEEND